MYTVKGDSSNSIDEMRTFDVLYLRPNDDGGGHFVYNIYTMQRNLACRVIGVNKKPIPMTGLMIKVINSQASREPAGVELSNIDSNTTLDDYDARGNDSDSDFEDNDKSYETSDDSTLDEDHELDDDPDQQEEDQQHHFNIQEVNNTDSEDEGVGMK